MSELPDRDPSPNSNLAFVRATRRAILLALLMIVPLAFTPDVTLDPFNVPKIGLLLAGIALLLGLHLFGAALGERLSLPRTTWLVPVLILVPLAIGWSMNPNKGWALLGEYWRFQGLIPYAAVALLSILIACSFATKEQSVVWALAIAGGGVGLYQLAQMVGFDPTAAGGATVPPSTASTLGNSNFVGGFLAIVFPLTLHLWLRGGRGKLPAILLTILVTNGIILSFSKGAAAAALASGAVLVGFRLAPRFPAAKRIGLVAAAIVAVALVGAIGVSTLGPQVLPTAASRADQWKVAIKVASTSPIWGHGPNGYFLERVAHRTAADAVAHRGSFPVFSPVPVDYQTSDDPHSVPLTFLANAGLLGLVGFLFAVSFLAKRGASLRPTDHVATAFFAGIVAYLVQGLVSVDEPALRLAGWACIGGLAAATASTDDATGRPHGGRTPGPLAVGLTSAALATALLGVWWVYGFVNADRLAWAGSESFSQGDTFQGKEHLRRALSFRDEYAYRQLLAEHLGLAALDRGAAGASLIEDMQHVNTYLESFPNTAAMLGSARILRYWSPNDPSTADAAAALYEKVGRLDPNNPLVEVEHAELLLDQGRGEAAERLLEPLTATRSADSPDVWGTLAVVRLDAGDEQGARTASERASALAATSCRAKIAEELVRVAAAGLPSPSVASGAAFSLGVSCDRGMFEFFLRRLPPGSRAVYGS